jgi:pSer/pThr/pTyr-binding forkhead associated (FHA) protein
MGNFKYSLEICSQENLGAVYQLNRNENVVGRGDVDISIDNPTLSANHCLLRHDGKSITVTDLQSRNGTAVNNKRIINETTLSSGDILTLGEVSLRVTASSDKKRLSSLASSNEEESNSIFKKILSNLSNKTTLKSPYEKASRNLLLLLVLLSWVILIFPLYFILQDKVTASRVERACALVSSLAATNTEAMKQGNQIMVDSSVIAKEPGVVLACIMTNQGVVWAPESLLNKKVSDSYGENAANAEQLLIQQRNDGNLDIALPIKYYDFKNGQSSKAGIARIIYDVKRVESGSHLFLVVGLCSIVYLIVAVYFSHKIVRTVKQDLFLFQEDCEDVIKGNTPFLEEKYSSEFNGLTVTFNRMLRKLGKSQPSVPGPVTEGNPAQLAEMVSQLEQAALLVDAMNVVVSSSIKAHELFGIKPEFINNKNMLEIRCKKDFYQYLLEFVCEAMQGGTKTTATLTTNSHRDIQVTSIPVAKGYCLFLLS